MAWTCLRAFAVAICCAAPLAAADAGEDPAWPRLAQFEMPKAPAEGGAPPKPLPRRLPYEYRILGTESEVNYRTSPDLDRRVPDDTLILTPQWNGLFTYRPTDWLEGTVELILDRDIPVMETDVVRLPDGSFKVAKRRRFSLLVDQLFVTFKDVLAPLEFTNVDVSVGRKNFEDERHWLWDTSLDTLSSQVRVRKFRLEAVVGRQTLADMDVFGREPRDKIDTYITYADYRGFEGIRLGAYWIWRDDRVRNRDFSEGHPWTIGLRSQGAPTGALSYWVELAHMRGRDELSKPFHAFAYDVGATYRFHRLPFRPSLTVGWAFATGDNPGTESRNEGFRQTGLQSNETRFAGVSEFKVYGEALDPELSNLRIFTAGLGLRPLPDVSLDLVYHDYRLDQYAEELRNSALTALMNQVDSSLEQPSKKVGRGFDIVLGIRNLFGIRRFGLDVRAGWFYPGAAFRRDRGIDDIPYIRDADKGFAVVAKIWY